MAEAADIEAQAARWVARCDAHRAGDDAQLTAWLLADPRHRAAFLRLAEAWTRTERLSRLRPANGPIDADLLAPGRAFGRHRPAHAWRVPLWVAAAVVAGAMFLSWWSLLSYRSIRVYDTGTSGLSRVALADGTVATLNADTELRVSFTRSERDVTLVRGEAQFRVVHDSRRPFELVADKRTLVDVGTVFDVRRDSPHIVHVLVTHGRVAVLPPGMARTTGPSAALPTISAGESAVLTHRSVTVRRESREQICRWLQWERRELSFQGQTLAQAVKEFNRYNYRKLVIDDPRIAGLQIGGNFRALDVQSFVAALGKSFDIGARPGPHRAIHLYRPAGP